MTFVALTRQDAAPGAAQPRPTAAVRHVAERRRGSHGGTARCKEAEIDDPAVVRSLINILAPCMLLLLGHRKLAKKALPSFQIDPEALTQHMLT